MREKRGSLTVWVSDEAIKQWKAAPRTTPDGPSHHLDLAITTALMLSATAATASTQRDRHIQMIAQTGRMAWRRASGDNKRASVESQWRV
ncbi:transposase [Azospirillum cavernae]|uniref:transposase n=1 Tax=Azospirillum cavernae TaxID=2320860 RepID=UPI0018F368E8